jgi:hypothetical protein
VLFARRVFGEDLMARAFREFSAGSTIPEEQLTATIFIPWFFFNWLPAPAKRPLSRIAPPPEPLAVTFLAEYGARLDDYQTSFIQAACSEPFSFFLVTSVDPGLSLTLRDLLLEREVTVKERSATEMLKRGNIIYARCVSLAGQSILLGVAPVVLPPDMQGMLLDLRDILRETWEKGLLDPLCLMADDGFLRSRFFEAADRTLNPPPPVLQNTDGDQCTFAKEERQSIETLLQEQKGLADKRPPQDRNEETPPELRAAVREHMKAHWDAWLAKPIPALKNQTPRRSALTPEGRERLEALLIALEYRNESPIQPELRPDVSDLRRKLGLFD